VIIADDNHVGPASRGIADAGVRVPQDADIVAFANIPFLAPSVVPVRHLGFDVSGMLQKCIDTIEHQRRGERVEPITLVPVRFADEPAK